MCVCVSSCICNMYMTYMYMYKCACVQDIVLYNIVFGYTGAWACGNDRTFNTIGGLYKGVFNLTDQK